MPRLKKQSVDQRKQRRREIMMASRSTSQLSTSNPNHGRLVTTAALHQGSDVFSEHSRGRQCTPMAFVAIALSTLVPPSVWNVDLMRQVLIKGDLIYKTSYHKYDYMDCTELPSTLIFSNYSAQISLASEPPQSGLLGKCTNHPFVSIEQALHHCSQHNCTGCLFTACGFTISLLFHSGSIYLFDSHQRDNTGMISPSGSAVLLQFPSTAAVSSHIRALYANWINDQFDCIPFHCLCETVPSTSSNFPCSTPIPTSQNEEYAFSSPHPKSLLPTKPTENTENNRETDVEATPTATSVLKQHSTYTLERYFSDQAVRHHKAKTAQLEATCHKNPHCQRRKQRHITSERERKRLYRLSLCEAKKQNTLSKDRLRKRESRANNTFSSRNSDRKKDSARKYISRLTKSESTRNQEKLQNAARKQQVRLIMSDGERDTQMKHDAARKRHVRLTTSETDRDVQRKQDAARKHHVRLTTSQTDRDVQRKQDAARKRHVRLTTSQTDRDVDRKQNAARKRHVRLTTSQTDRDVQRKQDAARKHHVRLTTSQTDRDVQRKQDAARKRHVRLTTSQTDRDVQRKQDATRKRHVRLTTSQTDRDVQRKQDAARKHHVRLTTSQTDRDVQRKQDAARRRFVRAHTQNTCTKQKDQLRKKQSRASRHNIQKQSENYKNLQRAQTYRAQKQRLSIKDAISVFRKTIKNGPTYTCSCCWRLLYRKTVRRVQRSDYTKLTTADVDNYLTGELSRDIEWICITCHHKMKQGKMPNQAQANSLLCADIPDVLKRLCPLELQLIARIIPFMKIVAMPRGAQYGIRGQVVLVPADLTKISNSLPRPTSQSQIISLALKRRLSDHHHVHKQYIRPKYVNEALHYLSKHSKCYRDVDIISNWQHESETTDTEFWNVTAVTDTAVNTSDELLTQEESVEQPMETKSSSTADSLTTLDSEDEVEMDNSQQFINDLQNSRSINSETCIQPINGPEVRMNEILNLAPAEGQRPVSVSSEPHWEAMAFPKLFPDGENTYFTQVPRTVKLSEKQYIITRLLSKDTRFAESPEYAFHALDWLERESVKQSISITTRKMFHEDISVNQLQNPDRLRRMLTDNQLFATFKSIRGTPQYFRQMHLDMLAKLGQLGPYTFFISGSAAEFHWPEVIQVVAAQYGENFTDDQVTAMDWQTKRMWLQRNPVTVARHIDFIFEQLWGKVLLSGAHPIGQILNYDLRKEMQGRGTAHFHAAVHIKDAPKLDVDTDEDFAAFADLHISCTIPDQQSDPELHRLVTTRQCHHHTRTCKKKKGVACRFSYPRPPSPVTVVARVPEAETALAQKKAAEHLQAKMYDALMKIIPSDPPPSLQDLLDAAGITLQQYQSAIKVAHRRTHVVMKRTPAERFINNYNSTILNCLRSNMDIQIITSMWACIAYITSYVCKPEKTMSDLMKKASKEANDGNIARQLYHVANQMRKGREVSHHEAIMRLLSIPFRRSNTPVVFIPTDFRDDRTRMLKPKHLLEMMEEDDTDIYLPTIHDKYSARPRTMDNICLAEFVANFTPASRSSENEKHDEPVEVDREDVDQVTPNHKITLQNGLGQMTKRKSPQIIRYHYISQDKDEEAYFHRLLLLYHPWRTENELKREGSYRHTFNVVKGQIMPVIKQYEPYQDQVDIVVDNFDPEDLQPEVWEQIAAQFEQDNANPLNVQPDPNHLFLDPDILPTDLSHSEVNTPSSSDRTFSLTSTYHMPDSEFYSLVRSLKKEQRLLFDYIFNWATETRLGSSVPPVYIFLSGGAGVGKSHLINAIYQGATRALRTPGQHPDQPTVLLTASTGKAATNINGTTLHSAFALPVRDKNSRFEYKKPGAEKLNTLRCNYINLKLIIADEVSMFGAKSLDHLHLSLQTIFEDHSKPFAGLSILAVGDLLQLNPVGDQAIFKAPNSGYAALAGSLWTQHFLLYELTQIVRQESDPQFADILSRVRTGSLTDADSRCLVALESTPMDHFPDDVVHIFLTNKQVSAFNQEKMLLLSNRFTIQARDSKRDTQTNSVPVTVTSENIYMTGGLPSTLTIAKGAKVMLTKNIDIADHLVNGSVGTLVDYDIDPQQPLAGCLYIKFDSTSAGREAKRSSPPNKRHLVPIKASVVSFTLTSECRISVERTMYPVTLAFAITAHKSQGSTYQYMVGDLTLPGNMKSVQQGQVYTVLSRAKSREGLRLINFSSTKIKVNEPALKEMQRMRKNSSFTWQHPLSLLKHDHLHVGFLNIRTLSLHAADLQTDSSIHNLTVLCLSETYANRKLDSYELPGFTMYLKATHHGLVLYSKCRTNDFLYHSDEFQFIARIIPSSSDHCKPIAVVSIYKPPTMSKLCFMTHLRQLLTKVLPSCDVILGGDFNLPPDDTCITTLSEHFCLTQLILQPTHQLGGILDLIFTSFPPAACNSGAFPLPYSDHCVTWVSVPL